MPIRGNLTNRLEKTIEKMETGDEGFTLPWALSFEPTKDKYNAYLYIKYPVSSYPERTMQMHIKRTGPRNEDFEVDIDSVQNYEWNIGKASYMGANEDDIVLIGQVDMF